MWPLYAKTTTQALSLKKLLDFVRPDDGVYVIIELSTVPGKDNSDLPEGILVDLLEDGLISNALVAKNASDAKQFWAVRENSFLCDERFPHGFWYDVSVPLGNLDEYSNNLFEKIKDIDPNLKVFMFGHLGDGNLHLTISSGQVCTQLESAINAAVYEGLNHLGGSFSAEHGIGNQKISSLEIYTDTQKLELIKAIKGVIDPNGIMNPGKVINL
jgi:FAD/FMN-containing dehydrogenase